MTVCNVNFRILLGINPVEACQYSWFTKQIIQLRNAFATVIALTVAQSPVHLVIDEREAFMHGQNRQFRRARPPASIRIFVLSSPTRLRLDSASSLGRPHSVAALL